MGKPTGFLEHRRVPPRRRPIPLRVRDWQEVYEPYPAETSRQQGARCMDCGVPFCHEGCPLGNLIPEWNDLVYRDDWADAADRLHATNNFPDFTGRLCPAPCEAACVLGINTDPVTIERIELEIVERAWTEGWVVPQTSGEPSNAGRPGRSGRSGPSDVAGRPSGKSGKSVAVVGSGPAGLACAQQLARAGHSVNVYERAEKPGGLLRYGIPEFKMEKRVLDRRLAQLRAEGVGFVCSTSVGLGAVNEPASARGVTQLAAHDVRATHDALVLAGGATMPRDLEVTGRHLRGAHFAMDYLRPANLVQEGALSASPIDAAGKRVVIIGGGDTGADCLGTAHRQGARSVHQLEIMPEPPPGRPGHQPWPVWPIILRTSAAHEEGGQRLWSVTTTELVDDGAGAVRALRGHQVKFDACGDRPAFVPVPGTDFEIECDLVLLALGFVGAERGAVVGELGVALGERGTVAADRNWATNVEGVFVCGDMTRGQSLIVWAIAEGRSAAAAVDRWLMGSTALPAPLQPGQRALA